MHNNSISLSVFMTYAAFYVTNEKACNNNDNNDYNNNNKTNNANTRLFMICNRLTGSSPKPSTWNSTPPAVHNIYVSKLNEQACQDNRGSCWFHKNNRPEPVSMFLTLLLSLLHLNHSAHSLSQMKDWRNRDHSVPEPEAWKNEALILTVFPINVLRVCFQSRQQHCDQILILFFLFVSLLHDVLHIPWEFVTSKTGAFFYVAR